MRPRVGRGRDCRRLSLCPEVRRPFARRYGNDPCRQENEAALDAGIHASQLFAVLDTELVELDVSRAAMVVPGRVRMGAAWTAAALSLRITSRILPGNRQAGLNPLVSLSKARQAWATAAPQAPRRQATIHHGVEYDHLRKRRLPAVEKATAHDDFWYQVLAAQR